MSNTRFCCSRCYGDYGGNFVFKTYKQRAQERCRYCKCSPLQDAIYYSAEANVILEILEADNDAVKCNSISYPSTLYLALQRRCSHQVIQAILHAHPDAAKDYDYGIPLIHYAIQQGCSDDTVLAILDADDNAAVTPMESGQLLFDKVIDNNCSSTVIKAVLDATVNAAKNRVPVDGKMLPIIFSWNSAEVA
jgi:hypothetical protein